jgi:hypothetical protein
MTIPYGIISLEHAYILPTPLGRLPHDISSP